MPFSVNGTFTIINSFTPNTPILSADVNDDFDDIAAGMTTLWGRTTSIAFVSRVFTASDTYIPTDGMLSAIIEVWGGGGGGGGAGSATATFTNAAGGGGAGSYSRSTVTVGDIGASKVVTVGAAGTAGVGSTGSNGGNGGDSSVGSLCLAHGGHGGIGVTGLNIGNGGIGGNTGTGDEAFTGATGFAGYNASANATDGVLAGAGAASALGDGGQGMVLTGIVSGHQDGPQANGFASGGAGGASINNGGAANGGAGAPGYVRITELIGPT